MRRDWTEGELLQVLALYRRIQFGQMHSRNPDVALLATILNRTPSAVAMKLVNFASFDEEHQTRGIKGMSHASALDKSIWLRYNSNWARLAHADPIAKKEISDEDVPFAKNTSKRVEVNGRIGQAYFRSCVLGAYGGACCITGIQVRALLRASHIIPWKDEEQTRLNPQNGLCLNALHDAAFDRGLITLDVKLQVVVSSRLRDAMSKSAFNTFFLNYVGVSIQAPERYQPSPHYLSYHREKVFVN